MTRVCLAAFTIFVAVVALERPATTQVVPVSAPAGVVISEVLFDPKPGDAPFIELLNAGSQPVDVSPMALQLGESVLPLIRAVDPLPPSALLLIRFDGQGRVEGRTIHAPSGAELPSSGSVSLRDANDDEIDRIAWGTEDGAADDDAVGTPPAGRTLGRPPGANEAFNQTQWVVYDPDEATPGAENRLPPVDILLPIDGASINAPAQLTWYTAKGASRYRVQIARDNSFTSPVLDTVVTRAQVNTGPLAPGQYVWRVQAIDSRGRPAEFSVPSGFEISASSTPAGRGIAFSFARQPAAPQASPALPDKLLPVALIYQHKDTAMLLLENPHRDDPHGWDRDHKTYDENDPSDDSNCMLASIAMVNHFFRGNLSEDRIGYEIKSRNAEKYTPLILADPLMAGLDGMYDATGITDRLREKKKGPEGDLNYGKGANPAQAIAGITFALNPTGSNLPHLARVSRYAEVDPLWTALTTELEHDQPLIGVRSNGRGTRTAHAFVVKGFGRETDGRRFLVINDPIDGVRQVHLDGMKNSVPSQFLWYFIPNSPVGRAQEVSVIQDTDGDGVVDFDETERFFTDPQNMDSDDDGVPDKDDIASGVFDTVYGYAQHSSSTKGRDFDGDQIPTERDPDSDDGGCKDGVEDRSADGVHDRGEKWNFDRDDDICGDVNGHLEVHKALRQSINGFHQTINENLSVVVRMAPMVAGQVGDLDDNGSTFWVHSAVTQLVENGDCPIFTRSSAQGSGRFTDPDTSIGGMVYHDDPQGPDPGGYRILVDAAGSASGLSTVDSCVITGTSRYRGGATTHECPGMPTDDTSRTFVFNCTTKPPPQLGTVITVWSFTGSVTISPPNSVGELPLPRLRLAH